ncbi:MAG: hypothetical protein NTY38_14575 [Acidobacteria bacterium]|nr:hypothetical protein [Acidobacteriota bacterium]
MATNRKKPRGSGVMGAVPCGSIQPKTAWKCVYTLDQQRRPAGGSERALLDAIRRGADLRIATAFRHNEHIEPGSSSPELIRETAEFRVTYLVDDRWVAGIMTLRQPISLPGGFGPRPSMSFFLYNQDGRQAIARPHLDGMAASGAPGRSPLDDHSGMPKYHQEENWDAATNAPSSNFVYDFDRYRFFVRDDWTQVLAHAASGRVLSGSVDALARAFDGGQDIKVAVRGLCADLGDGPEHEVLIQTGSNYYYGERKLFISGSHPLVRVRAAVPVRYSSGNWDFGWLMARTDGKLVRRLADPHTLAFRDSETQCAMRWFVR